MARAYNVRPSSLLGIDPHMPLAFQLDYEVLAAGSQDDVEESHRRRTRKGDALPPPKKGQKFASVAGMQGLGRNIKVKQMKIPESGVW